MPYTVKTKRTGVMMPDGRLYPLTDALVVLSDAEYQSIDPGLFVTGELELISSPSSGGGSGTGYVFIQAVAERIWRIPHQMGYFPGGITVIDTADDIIDANSVNYIDTNILELDLALPVSGIAYLS